MDNHNLLMREGIRALSKDFCKSLGQSIQDICELDMEMRPNRRPLYFQVEPFFMEFKDPPKGGPIKRADYDEYADWINRCLQGVKNQGARPLRASLFGWLSYYHPAKAQALLDNYNSKLPLYQGHPNLERCSDEAKARFRRQDREVDQEVAGEETKEPTLPKGSPTRVISQQASSEPTSYDDLGSGPEAPTKETADLPAPENAARERSSQNANKPAGVEDPHQEDKNNKRKLVVFGSLAALLLLNAAIIAAINPGIFGLSYFDEDAAAEPPTSSLAANDSSAALEEVSKDESSNGSEDAEPTEAEAEDESVADAPETPRQINRVWDEISQAEWSTKVLRYFYPFITRSNRADLLNAANAGNANAQTLAAIGHYNGSLSGISDTIAVSSYLRPACENGQGRACAFLAAQYSRGKLSLAQNAELAASYYVRACELRNQIGCYYEAGYRLQGKGMPMNKARAIRQFGGVCDAGVSAGCGSAMLAYAKGTDVAEDLQLARRYYDRSIQLGVDYGFGSFEEWLRIQKLGWGQDYNQ